MNEYQCQNHVMPRITSVSRFRERKYIQNLELIKHTLTHSHNIKRWLLELHNLYTSF